MLQVSIFLVCYKNGLTITWPLLQMLCIYSLSHICSVSLALLKRSYTCDELVCGNLFSTSNNKQTLPKPSLLLALTTFVVFAAKLLPVGNKFKNVVSEHKWRMTFMSNSCEFVRTWMPQTKTTFDDTVYPKKYAHGFCFAVLCCGYTLTDFPISIRLTSLALWQSNDCPSASKATLMNMDKYFKWIHYERLHNHNKAKHNKTVCIFLGIYCKSISTPLQTTCHHLSWGWPRSMPPYGVTTPQAVECVLFVWNLKPKSFLTSAFVPWYMESNAWMAMIFKWTKN